MLLPIIKKAKEIALNFILLSPEQKMKLKF